jgi:hypothetical protein
MIINADDDFRKDIVVAIGAGHVSPQSWLNVFADALNAVLCAEHQMDVVLGIGMRQEAPPGLLRYSRR